MSRFAICDYKAFVFARDHERLRRHLRRLDWVQERYGPLIIERLATELLAPVAQARIDLPVMVPKIAPIPGPGRVRRPGGGRKRDEARAILACEVREAMRRCGMPAGASNKHQISPLLDVLRICWFVATGKKTQGKGKSRRPIVGDARRLMAKERRWEMQPEALATPEQLAEVAGDLPPDLRRRFYGL